MSTWLKRTLIILLVFGLCWAGAVWYWSANTRVPETSDLALTLLALPVALLGGIWVVGKVASKASEPAAPAVAAAATAADVPPVPSALPQLDILATALRMPHGSSPTELGAALADQSARLDLDPELRDSEGFPILAGRADDVDTAPLQAWIEQQPNVAVKLSDDQLRALAMGGDVATELSWQALEQAYDSALQLAPQLPSDWPQAVRELGTRWLMHNITEAGWPDARLSLRITALPGTASPFLALQDIAVHSKNRAAPELTMLVACDSSISEDAVERLNQQGLLFSARNEKGCMPSEGAAALLLRRAAVHAPGIIRLHAMQSDTPSSKPERADQKALQALADKTLETAGVGAHQLTYVAGDCDHRAARMTELMGCVGSAWPELDTDSQVACVGTACGHTNAVNGVAALALAQQYALDNNSFALCLSNVAQQLRAAVLVGPGPAASAPTLS